MTSLRQRMLEDMQVRGLSPRTQQTYVETVARFARHCGRSPAGLGLEEIRAYQVYLTNERRLASSSLVVAVSALRLGLSRSLLNFASGGLPVSAPSRLFYATSATAPSGGASASKAPTR